VTELAGRGVAISMAAVGKPEENRYADRLMRIIRQVEIDLSEYRDFAELYSQLGRFLDDVYNRKRSHSALGYLTRPSSSSNGPWSRRPWPYDLDSPKPMASGVPRFSCAPSAQMGLARHTFRSGPFKIPSLPRAKGLNLYSTYLEPLDFP
jgi:Integrase core domain